MSELVASEAPEQQREDRHPHEPGQLKSHQIASEKCVIGRAGQAPRGMRTFVVNEIVTSETPERSISLKCVPVKHESNTQRSEIEPLIGGMKHQRHAKSMKSSQSLAQKCAFSIKVLRRRSGVSLAIISTHTSCTTAVGARLFKLLMKNLTPEQVLE